MTPWNAGIKDYDQTNWIGLKMELDLVTNRRFSEFFCNEVVCCSKLLAEFKPFISRNLTLLQLSTEDLYGGTVLQRQGMSASVGGASYSVQGIESTRSSFGTTESPTLLPQLLMLCMKYGLMYPAPRNKGPILSKYACGKCSGCVCKKSRDCGCGGYEC